MPGRLSSPRFRRRLAWSLGSVVVVGGAVTGALLVGNTGHSSATAIDRTKPAWVYKAPPSMTLSRADRLELFRTSSQFVRTAVRREHLDSAWEMLAPEMKAGQTRESWDTGFNNVVPFKADGIESWNILYSYDDDVAIDLSLFSRGKKKDWAGKTFTIELKRAPTTHRWLVASWVPKGIGGGGTLSPNRRSGPPPPPTKAAISAKWLLAPAVLLVAVVLALLGWLVRGAVQERRAARRYAKALGYNSSSNPS
jgi:hypothetical protein